MQNAENKSKKFVVLATYVVAVICLLAGLFFPLFNGREILALKLVDVFKSLLGKAPEENPFALANKISLFGIAKLTFDCTALVLALYALITALAVLAFIPVAFSVRKQGIAAKRIYYVIEIPALIVLALFFAITLKIPSAVNYNMVIAAAGVALAAIVLCASDKHKAPTAKIILFLLSVIAFAGLFDFPLKFEFSVLGGKFSTAAALYGDVSEDIIASVSGASVLNTFYTNGVPSTLAALEWVRFKTLFMLAAIASTAVLVNLFIDALRLPTKKAGTAGRAFNVVRYGLEFIAAAGTLVMAFVCKKTIGAMLIVILAAATVQLAIALIALIKHVVKNRRENANDEDDEENYDEDDEQSDDEALEERPVSDDFSYNAFAKPEPIPVADEAYEKQPIYDRDEYVSPKDDYRSVAEDEYVSPEDDDDGYVSPEEDADANRAPVVEEREEELDYEIKTDGTYLLPSDNASVEEEPVVEERYEEKLEEREPEEKYEDAYEEEPEVSEPVEEEPVVEERYEEKLEEREPEKAYEEPAPAPRYEDIKPYNPYERHSSNPFRNFEQPPQPYNPYAQQAAKPEPKPEPKPEFKPVPPPRPAYEPKYEKRPISTYKPYEPQTNRPQSGRPLRPNPIIQEFKPVPPISEQPQTEKQVYTIDKIYAGPVDDFIRKLSNDERIEFAMTFIEKSRGELGSIPDYAVGGDNKKFFSLSFIYLGRIRGLVSDGLLNKMYKELNML